MMGLAEEFDRLFTLSEKRFGRIERAQRNIFRRLEKLEGKIVGSE